VKEKLNRKKGGGKQDSTVEVEGVGGNQCIPLFSLALDVFTFNPPLFIPLLYYYNCLPNGCEDLDRTQSSGSVLSVAPLKKSFSPQNSSGL